MSRDLEERVRDTPGNRIDAVRLVNTDPLPVKGVLSVRDQIPLFYKYDQRGIIQSRDGDIVFVTGEYDKSWVAHIHEMGFGTGNENIVPFQPSPQLTPLMARFQSSKELLEHSLFEIIKRHDGESPLIVDPYIGTDEAQEYSQTIQDVLGVETLYNGTTTKLSDLFNNKVEFYNLVSEWCEHAQVGPYSVVNLEDKHHETALREAWKEHQLDGRVAVKGEYGASGAALWKLGPDNFDEILGKMRQNPESERFIVQPLYDIENSLSQLIYIDEEGVHLNEYISGQVLLDKEWNGNFFPHGTPREDREQIKRAAREFAELKRSTGYRGRANLDFMRPGNEGHPMQGVQLFAEDNARMTGSSAYANLQHELEERHGENVAVVSYKIKPNNIHNYDELVQLLGTDVFYDGSAPVGIIPGHFITGGSQNPEETEVMFAAVSPMEQKEKLYDIIDATAKPLGADDVARETKRAIA